MPAARTGAIKPSARSWLFHGHAAAVLASNSRGIPPTLLLDTPETSVPGLRNELNDIVSLASALAGTPNDLSRHLSQSSHSTSETWFIETKATLPCDLADVVGVCASKSPTLKLSEIVTHTDLADLFQRHRQASTLDELLQTGFDEAFRSERMFNPSSITAMRFGASGALYLCNSGGSHRIAAVRAELLRLGRSYPLEVTVRSLYPSPVLIALLQDWEIVATTMSQPAVAVLFRGQFRLRSGAVRAIKPPDSSPVTAIVRRESSAAKKVEELAAQGRLFSVRHFLADQGC